MGSSSSSAGGWVGLNFFSRGSAEAQSIYRDQVWVTGTRLHPSPCLRPAGAAKVRAALSDWRLAGAAPLPLAAWASLFPGPRCRLAAADWAAEVWRRRASGSGSGAGVPAGPPPVPAAKPEARRSWAWDPGREEELLWHTNMDLEAKVKKVGGRGRRAAAASPARDAAPWLLAAGGAHGTPGASRLRVSGPADPGTRLSR